MKRVNHTVYKSLSSPILFLGVPYQYFIASQFLAVSVLVILSSVIFATLLALGLYLFGRFMTKHDARWLEIISIASKNGGINLADRGRRYVV